MAGSGLFDDWTPPRSEEVFPQITVESLERGAWVEWVRCHARLDSPTGRMAIETLVQIEVRGLSGRLVVTQPDAG